MHLTRREVCASASHRPLTDRHGRPSSVWARSLPCQPPGGTGVARCAAGQRPKLPLSTGCVCWVALGSCGIAAPGPWSPGRARRLRWGARAVGSATLGQATGPRRPERRGRSSRAPGGSPAPARGCLEQPWSGGWVAWAGCCACGVTCDAVDRGGVHDREVRLLVARALVRVRVRVRVRVS